MRGDSATALKAVDKRSSVIDQVRMSAHEIDAGVRPNQRGAFLRQQRLLRVRADHRRRRIAAMCPRYGYRRNRIFLQRDEHSMGVIARIDSGATPDWNCRVDVRADE